MSIIKISSIQIQLSKGTYMTLIKILLKKLFDTWTTFDSYLIAQQRVGEKYEKIKTKPKWCHLYCMKVGLVRWLDEIEVVGWDCVRKLNAFEELAWILLLQDETLVQETKYLAFHFCCFSGIMLCRNLGYFCILWSANH